MSNELNLSGVAEAISQKLKAAGLAHTVKDETQKIAKMDPSGAVKSAHRFKVEMPSIEEPIGVTVVEVSDPTQKTVIKGLFEMQSKMIEQVSPGKYSIRDDVMASESNAVVMMLFRKNDQASAEKIREALEK